MAILRACDLLQTFIQVELFFCNLRLALVFGVINLNQHSCVSVEKYGLYGLILLVQKSGLN